MQKQPRTRRLLSVLLTLLMVIMLLPTFAFAAEEEISLDFDAAEALLGTYTVSGVEYKCYQVPYCTKPITGKTWGRNPSEDYFKLNIKVPTNLTDEEIASAPILVVNPWSGDNGAAVPAPDARLDALKTMALQKGWVLVEPGMRGANNCTYEGYNDGKLPWPLADLKAAISYLHYNYDTIPGNTNHIWIAGTSSGGCATVMIASSGDSDFFAPYLEEIGAADASNAVFGAMPSCPVMNRANADAALSWERWGDLSKVETANEVNKRFAADFITYFNGLNLKAEFAVPSAGIRKGDTLTADTLDDYLMVFVKQSAVKYLNTLGGKDQIDAYLATDLPASGMYGTSPASRSWIKPVYAEDGNTVIDINGTWAEFWHYVVGDDYYDNSKVLNFQYDKPMIAPDECFNDLTDSNGVFNANVGTGLFAPWANASSFSFGKPADTGAVFTYTGQKYIQDVRNMTISDEYQTLIDMQRNSVNPMYFVMGEGAKGATVADHWYMRTGSIDLVTPHPIFFGLATALENQGKDVNAALVWEEGHGLTSDLAPFFDFADEAMAISLDFDAEEAYVGTYTYNNTEFDVYQATYCANPITGLTWGGQPSENYFKLNISVPTSLTAEEAAKAPILMYNPWGGDRGSAVRTPGSFGTNMQKMAIERGWIVIEPGMRGANCTTKDGYNYGKIPYPLADLKAAIRYLRYGDNATTIPGDKDHIFFAGTSSGGCATVMIGSSADSAYFDLYLEEIGAADTSDAVFCAAPSCPVMMRSNGDIAIAWERWGDLNGNENAQAINIALTQAYVPYLNSLNLKAEFAVPEAGIRVGDKLTDKNFADYMMVYEKQAALKFLNNLGGKDAVEAYLASTKGIDMYGHPAILRSSILKPVLNGDKVVDLDNTWEDIWFYNLGGEQHMNPANDFNWQYDKPLTDPNVQANAITNGGYDNASTKSFGKPTDYGAVYSVFGQKYIKSKGVTINAEYVDLYERQRKAVDPMYFVLNEGADTEGRTLAPNWYMRTGSVDLVVPTPNFFALATKLQNLGCDVDAALVWDQGHGLTSDLEGFFTYADKILSTTPDPGPAPASGGSVTTYPVTAAEAKNGTITVSPKNAAPGQTVTVTVTPEAGYELKNLSVTDKNGNSLALTDLGNGKYSFRMPSGPIDVKTEFKQISVIRTSQGILLDGEPVEVEAYNIGGYNYFKLRDIAALLNGTKAQFSIDYNEITRVAALITGEAYKANGSELKIGKDLSATCVISSQTITVNGTALIIEVYNIGGYNYFKLRDLGTALGFGIDYKEATRTVLINTK